VAPRIVNSILARWNGLLAAEAEKEISPCCGSSAWARGVVARRPFANRDALLGASDETWRALSDEDWLEAFRAHPRIGESKAERPVPARSAAWSAEEQGALASEMDAESIKARLAEGNHEYERRFGRIFIVCATGKSGAEMLEILRRGLGNDAAAELREAVEQQRQITRLRLERWMAG
jgi:2-oxo-4-hydroxy-4-carboxy-5-ureidoimidazoline decarboxylase